MSLQSREEIINPITVSLFPHFVSIEFSQTIEVKDTGIGPRHHLGLDPNDVVFVCHLSPLNILYLVV